MPLIFFGGGDFTPFEPKRILLLRFTFSSPYFFSPTPRAIVAPIGPDHSIWLSESPEGSYTINELIPGVEEEGTLQLVPVPGAPNLVANKDGKVKDVLVPTDWLRCS